MDAEPESTPPGQQARVPATPKPEVPASAPVRQLRWVPELDGLRGVAVLLVILSHSFVVGFRTRFSVVNNIFRGGFLGVNIFFVLSGFLITALLLREQADRGHVRIGTFYAGRALRLLPALYVLLVAHMVYVAVTHPFPFEHELVSVRAAAFYYFNWQVVWNVHKVATDLGHLWSLSIEEQFYLVWPAVLILGLGLRRRARTVAAVLIAVIVIIAVNRAVLWHPTAWQELLNRTDTQADGLFVGALLAVLWVRRRTPTRGLVLTGWIAVGIIAVNVEFFRGDRSFYFKGGSTLFAVSVAALILATLETNWFGNRLLRFAPLRAIGRVSYGLYLWHYPIFWVVARYGAAWPAPVPAVVGFTATGTVTVLSWVLVEQPALRWKRRIQGRRQPGERGTPPTPAVPAPGEVTVPDPRSSARRGSVDSPESRPGSPELT
jgi:peptidoglycan/LPS O-acetylase OafA/YrhL